MSLVRRLDRRRPALVAALLVCSVLSCRSAFAQGRAQAMASSSGASQRPGWTFHIGTQGAFETNPTFQASPNGSADFSGSAGGGVDYSFTGARSTFTLSGEGRGLLYRELTLLNTFAFGGAMAAAYRPGPKTQLTFNGAVSSDYTRRSDILLSQGIVLPQSQVLTMRLAGDVSHSFSPRTTLSVSGRYEKAQFDSEELTDGYTVGATARLGHRVNQAVGFALGYSHDQTNSELLRRSIDTGYGGISFILNPRVSFELNAGASSIGGGVAARQVTPYGTASINIRNPRLVMGFLYTHLVRQDYGGGGVSEADLGTFYLNRSFGRRRANFSTAVTYGLSRPPRVSAEVVSQRTYGATAGLQFPLGRQFRADWGYSYFRTSLPLIDSHSTFVALSYRTAPQ